MSAARRALLVGLGAAVAVGGVLLATRKARAATPTVPEPAPAPAPADVAAADTPDKRALLAEWQRLSAVALDACTEATSYQDEWWRLQDRIDAGEAFSADLENQAAVGRAWVSALERCERLNAQSLAAMAAYEAA